MYRTFLGLGSNTENRLDNINAACALIEQKIGTITRISEITNTKALVRPGAEPQTDYLNCVLELYVSYSPLELLEITQTIEKQLGRRTKGDWAPRTIDIDIIFMGDLIINIPNKLEIPHPGWSTRPFVYEPIIRLLLGDYSIHHVVRHANAK